VDPKNRVPRSFNAIHGDETLNLEGKKKPGI
jgi:hypothetical protein